MTAAVDISGTPDVVADLASMSHTLSSEPRFALFTVARDRETIARDCYILVVLFFLFFFIFFRPPNFRHPCANFRETLPHDAVCAEIVYLL